MTALHGLPRLWATVSLPGITATHATYSMLELDAMPAIQQPLSGNLRWLLDAPTRRPGLQRDPRDPPQRDADADGLKIVAQGLTLPMAFRRFIEDPEPRRHVRSATACFLDLGHFPVRLKDGGTLVHFLADQQRVLHWLLYTDPKGGEAVIVTPAHLGFDDGETEPLHELDLQAWVVKLAVCGDSFEQFICRFWAMNELFFELVARDGRIERLPAELRSFAERYPRDAALLDLFEESPGTAGPESS